MKEVLSKIGGEERFCFGGYIPSTLCGHDRDLTQISVYITRHVDDRDVVKEYEWSTCEDASYYVRCGVIRHIFVQINYVYLNVDPKCFDDNFQFAYYVLERSLFSWGGMMAYHDWKLYKFSVPITLNVSGFTPNTLFVEALRVVLTQIGVESLRDIARM